MKHYSLDELSAYLDRELSESKQMEIAAHLRECPECSRSVEQWLTIGCVVKSGGEDGAADEFVSAVMSRVSPAQIEEKNSFADKFFSWVFPAVQVIASLVLLLGQVSNNTFGDTEVDTEMVLLAGLENEAAQSDLSGGLSDPSIMLGFNLEEL